MGRRTDELAGCPPRPGDGGTGLWPARCKQPSTTMPGPTGSSRRQQDRTPARLLRPYLTASINGLCGPPRTTGLSQCGSHPDRKRCQITNLARLDEQARPSRAEQRPGRRRERRRRCPFLGTVGTRPDCRLGFARAVLTPMLRRCDRDGLPAVLDTSTLSNVQMYSRLGFETTAKLQSGDRAPRVWVMTRTPQTNVPAPRTS